MPFRLILGPEGREIEPGCGFAAGGGDVYGMRSFRARIGFDEFPRCRGRAAMAQAIIAATSHQGCPIPIRPPSASATWKTMTW